MTQTFASQLIALLESEWRPAVATALDEFYERIQCSNCSFIPGAYGWNRKLLPDGQRRLDALIVEMKRFPVEELTLGKVMQYKAKLGKLEKEYIVVPEGGTPCTLVSPALLKRQWRFSIKIYTF
jgi:hypothetical protein